MVDRGPETCCFSHIQVLSNGRGFQLAFLLLINAIYILFHSVSRFSNRYIMERNVPFALTTECTSYEMVDILDDIPASNVMHSNFKKNGLRSYIRNKDLISLKRTLVLLYAKTPLVTLTMEVNLCSYVAGIQQMERDYIYIIFFLFLLCFLKHFSNCHFGTVI